MGAALHSANDLLRNPPDGRWELVDGAVALIPPPGFDHGRIALNVGSILKAHVDANGLGTTCVEGGFVVSRNPDTVLGPDVAFVAAGREREGDDGFFPGAPDLAVEVVSPRDRASEVDAKAERYLDAGTRLVWLVRPQTRSVTVQARRAPDVILQDGDALTGHEVVPGFRCDVTRLFA